MSKAVIFFAPGLEECEGLLCVDLLRRSGVEVTIAAVGGEKIVKSARSISIVADALAEELDYSAFDAAILPGGIPGVDNLKADATVRKVCTEFAAAGKVVAAICAAPSVLAAFGILQGKKATVYPGMEDKLTAARGRVHRPAHHAGRQHHYRRSAGCGHSLCAGPRQPPGRAAGIQRRQAGHCVPVLI